MLTTLLCASPAAVAAAFFLRAARIARAAGGLPLSRRPDDAQHDEKKGRCHHYGDDDSLGHRGLTCAHKATEA
jgi:hypothetical protein